MDQKAANTKKKKPKNTQSDSEKSLFSIANSLTKMESKHIFSDENEKGAEKKFWIPIRIAIISIFVNFILAIGTFLLWNQASKQSKSAENAAESAKQSIEIAQENFRIENSALLAPIEIGLSFNNLNFKKCTISLNVKNYGKTVADSVSCWSYYVVSEKNISYNPIIRKEFSKIPSFILPYEKSTIEDSIDERYLNSKNPELASKVKKFFFYGEVRYKTIGKFDTLEFMYVNTSISGTGDFESYGTFNKLR